MDYDSSYDPLVSFEGSSLQLREKQLENDSNLLSLPDVSKVFVQLCHKCSPS